MFVMLLQEIKPSTAQSVLRSFELAGFDTLRFATLLNPSRWFSAIAKSDESGWQNYFL